MNERISDERLTEMITLAKTKSFTEEKQTPEWWKLLVAALTELQALHAFPARDEARKGKSAQAMAEFREVLDAVRPLMKSSGGEATRDEVLSRIELLCLDENLAASESLQEIYGIVVDALSPSPAKGDAGERDADGRIEWHGGECPMPMGTAVEVRFRNGGTDAVNSNDTLRWAHLNLEGDIIAYRLAGSP